MVTETEERAVVKAEPIVTVELAEKRFEWDKLKAQAKIVLASGLAPDTLKSEDAVLAVMLTGKELDLPAMVSLRELHVIHKRVGMSAKLMKALVAQSGKGRFEILRSDAQECTMKAVRTDVDPPESLTVTWNMARVPADWQKKDNYKNIPGIMFRYRCTSELCNALFPDVTLGLLTPEELQDIKEIKPVEVGTLSMDDLKAPEDQSGGEAATPAPEEGQSQAQEEGQAPTTETLSQGTEEAPAAPPAASPAEEEEPPPPHVPSLVEQLEAMGVNGKVFPPVRQLVAEGVVETVEDLRDWLATMPKAEALQVQKMGEGTYGMLLEALDVMEPPADEPEGEAPAADATEPQKQRQQELGDNQPEEAPAEGEEKPAFEMEMLKPDDQKMSAKETWVSIAHISNAEGKTFTLWMHTESDELGCGCPQNKESGDCEHVQFARDRIKSAK